MRVFLLVLAGFLGGIFGGMGMGGGTLLIPLLLYMCGLPQHTAQSVNMAAFIPMALVALGIHSKKGLVDYKRVWPIVIAASLAGAGGAFLAVRARPELLTKLFGGFIALLGVYQLAGAGKGRTNRKGRADGG
ncbi:MAG: sulfite exporter TauE/SafE family protein [Clostridiales bacterium]|jgi:uncharacterized membrane protein YfcA|nr:sulfite exporter TauE/SafE family protein [Clostridiales bacterium]